LRPERGMQKGEFTAIRGWKKNAGDNGGADL